MLISRETSNKLTESARESLNILANDLEMKFKGELQIFLIAAFMVSLFFAPFFSSQALWSSGTDLVTLYYPIRSFMRDTLLQGQWPLWNPYLSLGIPVQTGVRSLSNPLLLASLWMPTATHVKVTLWLHTTLSITIMALFLRYQGLSRAAALTAGLTYGISGFAIGRIFAGHLDWTEILPHIPLVMWLGLWALSRSGAGWTLLWGVSLALFTISGHYQVVYMTGISLVSFHLLLVLGGYRCQLTPLKWCHLFESEVKLRPGVEDMELLAGGVSFSQRLGDFSQLLKRWLLAATVALALSLFQLLPAWETLSYSNRVSNPQAFAASQQSAIFWLTSLLPRFFDGKTRLLWWSPWPNTEAQAYLGILPLTMIVLALIGWRYRCWLPLLLGALLAAWFSLGPGYGIHDVMIRLDPVVFKNFRGACRWTILYTFFAAWLVGLGVERLRMGRTWVAILWPGIPLLLTMNWLMRETSRPDLWNNFVLAINPEQKAIFLDPQGESMALILQRAFAECGWSLGLCLATWALGLLPKSRRAWGAFLLLSLDLAVLLRPYLVMVPPAALEITSPVRQVLTSVVDDQRVMWDPALDWVNRGMIDRICEIGFYEGAAPDSFVMALNLVEGLPVKTVRLLLQPWYNHPLWNVLGVSIVVSSGSTPPWPGLEPIEASRGVFRNPKAFKRVYMVGETRWVPEPVECLRQLLRDPMQAARVSLVNAPASAPTSLVNPVYKISQQQIQANRVVLDVVLQGEGMLVLSDTYWPGWQVRVNGKPEILYSLHGGLQRGVWLTAEQNHVEFFYWPKTLTVGLCVSVLMAVILCLACGLYQVKRRFQPVSALPDQPNPLVE